MSYSFLLFHLSFLVLITSINSNNGLPSLLLNYITTELENQKKEGDESRIVFKGEHFVSVVPFWASWPFESMILPYKYVLHIFSEWDVN